MTIDEGGELSSSGRPLTRTIWMFWQQGFEAAPPLVRLCLRSWQAFNPGWRVVALDERSLCDWIDLDAVVDVRRPDLTVQKLSNIVRLCLLREHGGVWTDATVICLRPLDDWLHAYMDAGFFAFRNPGPDRLSSNWFLAAQPDSPLLVALHDAFIGLWDRYEFTNQSTELGDYYLHRLKPVLSRSVRHTLRWTSPCLLEKIKAYPYFIFHYTFNRLIHTDPDLKAMWESAAPYDARSVHLLKNSFARAGDIENGLAALHVEGWPVQKLDWRLDLGTPFWKAVLPELERIVENAELGRR